jgi:hypothetical protein
MFQKQPELMPPLWLWIFLSLTAITILAMSYVYGVREKDNDFYSRRSYVEERLQTAGNKPVVLLLGTSLMQCDLDSTAGLEMAVQKLSGVKPLIIKVWKIAADLDAIIDNMPILEKAHPALLIVESNMLCYMPYKGNVLNRTLFSFSDFLRSRPLHENYLPDNRYDHIYNLKEGEIKKLRNGIVDTTKIAGFRKLAYQLHKQGTTVIMINFPLQDVYEKRKWVSSDTTSFNRNLQYLKQNIPFHFYQPDFYLDSNFYLDGAHMNKKGSAVFSNWLCDVLSKELQQL